jgi:signal transduction histidine kinase/DNA-binding response OmpR family regulator
VIENEAGAAHPRGLESLFPGDGEVATLMRARDWSQSPLGPPEQWPQTLRAIVRIMLTSRFAIWLGWGRELTFLYNDAYRAMTLGPKHPGVLGRPTREVWAEIWPQIGPRIEKVLATGEATWDKALMLFLERSGYPEETYHTFSYSPIADDSGIIRGNLCIVSEETDQVIGERRLALLRELAVQLASLNTTADVLAATERALATGTRDVPFFLLYRFDEACRHAQLVSSSWMPAGAAGLHPTLDAATDAPWPVAALLARLEPILVETLPGRGEWPWGPWDRAPQSAVMMPVAQQGKTRPAGFLIAGLNPYRPFDENYQSFVGLLVGQIAAGLSNAWAYEAERRRAEALAELDRAKTVFFSNVSHEFRTPLTLMLGSLEDLRDGGELAPQAHDPLATAQRNGLRLLRLVNTLLDFSRIEAGRVQATYEPLDLAETTADLVSVFRSATERAGLRLVVDCPPLGEPVYLDRGMWEKVVLNLLSNAFKFTLEGEIEVRLERLAGAREVRVVVRDTGIGIPAPELPHLFERFHRVEGASGRTHEGSGIGLALMHELVKLHGGAVAVASELGRGSTFTVTLQLGTDHLPADRIARRATGTAAAAGATSGGAASAVVEEALRWLPEEAKPAPMLALDDLLSMEGPAAPRGSEVILLADDNADMRGYIRRLLAPRWHVETVSNGQEALAAARVRRPDLVISDIMMPAMDGFGLLQALRANPATRDVPVMLLSARAGEEARIEGIEAGADDYLVKPFSARELLARVDAQMLRVRVRALEDASARRLASVFAQAPVAIALLRGPEHVFELANPFYLKMVNERPLKGLRLREAMPEVVEQGIVDLLDGVFRSGQAHLGKSLPVLLNRGPGGTPEEGFFDFVYQPLFDGHGKVEGIAIVAYDVTELARARREAEVANRAKDEFLAMLGHELRNPLAPISTALQLLKMRGVDAAEKERRVIERQVKHLVTLVDDLLDVSRLTRGKLQLEVSRVELSTVVGQAIETVASLLDLRRHSLTVAVPATGLAVDGDEHRLVQVVANLLGNAAKYTDPGGSIAIAGTREEGDAVLRIRDNGIGITPEMLSRIFELFVQTPQALDRSHGGLCLGLALSRGLLALHQGSIEARSDGPGRGAEFTVRLPLPVTSEALPTGGAETAEPDLAAASGLRILVVDDNRDAALMLATALSLQGHQVQCAFDGPQALAMAEKQPPQVAILDLGLPLMDGFELAKRVAADPVLRRTRLIAVTGYGQQEDRRRTAEACFAAHFVKPVDLAQLSAAITDLTAPDRTAEP